MSIDKSIKKAKKSCSDLPSEATKTESTSKMPTSKSHHNLKSSSKQLFKSLDARTRSIDEEAILSRTEEMSCVDYEAEDDSIWCNESSKSMQSVVKTCTSLQNEKAKINSAASILTSVTISKSTKTMKKQSHD